MVGGALASQRVDEFWRNTARTLNSIGDGTSKEAAAWKTYWHELKYRARKRDTEVRQHARGTGGGPAKKPLTVTESRILQLLGEVSYAGNPEVQIPLNIPSCSGPVPSTVGTRPNVPSLSRAPAPVPSCSAVPAPVPSCGAGAVDGTGVPSSPTGSHPNVPSLSRAPIVHVPSCSAVPAPVPSCGAGAVDGTGVPSSPTGSHPNMIAGNASPPPELPLSGSEDSVPVGPRRGRTSQIRNTRPYRRRRYDDPPEWARRYEEQRLRIDRSRAHSLERLVEIAEQVLALYRRSVEGNGP